MLPQGIFYAENDELTIGSISALTLADRFGTPLYVIDEQMIRDNLRTYLEAGGEYGGEFRVAYAGKAMLNLALCKIVAQEGCWLDVVSGGELYTALRANFPASRILFHGNNKTERELSLAVRNGVGRIVVDNEDELKTLSRLVGECDKRQKVQVRVNPGVEAFTHRSIETARRDSKFGFAPEGEDLSRALSLLERRRDLLLTGFHAHIGSQIDRMSPFLANVDRMVQLATDLWEREAPIEINLGGGLGIGHGSDSQVPDIEDYVAEIVAKVESEWPGQDFPRPIIYLEPGRSVIGSAGLILYTIGVVKDVPGLVRYYIADGGMNDNPRPALYGARYQVVPARRKNSERADLDYPVHIAGKCCESGDIIVENYRGPSLARGDVVAVLNSAAYTYSMASNYNRLPRAGVALVNEDDAELIVERESYADLVSHDRIPRHLMAAGRTAATDDCGGKDA